MPRAKVTFSTTKSPNDADWPRDPEQAMRNIAKRNNAVFIDGSLVFATGGKHAEALFETVEPGEDSDATRLHRLGGGRRRRGGGRDGRARAARPHAPAVVVRPVLRIAALAVVARVVLLLG